MDYPYPDCIRCGMCCMVSVCAFGEEIECGDTGECGYLSVDDDDQAVCGCDEAIENYVGSGCIFQRPESADTYLLHLNEYRVEERRIALKEGS